MSSNRLIPSLAIALLAAGCDGCSSMAPPTPTQSAGTAPVGTEAVAPTPNMRDEVTSVVIYVDGMT